MGILSKSVGFKALSMEGPSVPLTGPGSLYELLGGQTSESGVSVNEKTAFRQTTVYSCIKVISEDLSSVSLDIYQTLPNSAVRIAPEHRLYSLLHDRPNPMMSSQVWRMAMLANVLSNGNGYSWIKRDKAARVIALIPLDPMRTAPVHVNGNLLYGTTQTTNGQVTYIEPDDILHFMNATQDGIVGMSPISYFKNAIGLALASESFGAKFFSNGMRSTGVFTHPYHLDTEAYENLKTSVYELATGSNASRPLILEEGLTFTPLSLTPDEAQFLQVRKF